MLSGGLQLDSESRVIISVRFSIDPHLRISNSSFIFPPCSISDCGSSLHRAYTIPTDRRSEFIISASVALAPLTLTFIALSTLSLLSWEVRDADI